MTEPEEIGGARPAAEPGRKRVRRHRRRPLLIRYWWAVPLVAIAAIAPALWNRLSNPHATTRDPLPGYIADDGKIEEEYLTFTGKPLDPAAESEFDRATQLMRGGNYANAVMVLEATAKDIPVPAVFNDLGVLYGKLKDGSHAIKAFRDALARDHDYAPVRANLKRMNMAGSLDPGETELEPNNDITHANAVWLDRPVQGTIAPGVGDVDSFWFTTPRPPRDRISVAAISRSVTLIPRMRIYDQAGKMITGLKEAAGRGAGVRFDFSPPPNTLYYVQVDGVSGSSGPYTLTVSPLHAYDVYEPNDTITAATRIVLGQTIEANIMDGDDTDFYTFTSPAAASVSIDVVSRSPTLELGLGTFAPDQHFTGFAPDVKSPRDPIHHVIAVEANQWYFVQVFSKGDTTGPYSLVVK
jgi:hypothetical protein